MLIIQNHEQIYVALFSGLSIRLGTKKQYLIWLQIMNDSIGHSVD